VARYRRRVSGALYDRLDIAIEVPSVTAAELATRAGGNADDATSAVRARVAAARERQLRRQGKSNARLEAPELERHAMHTPEAERLFASAMSRLSLSARGYHRAVRVARSIADLAGSDAIEVAHAAEAIGYRRILADG
ncbi:MAG: ATP-binding protein, partial [Proteobacteria bacterium]|nr:ATP-binding protein [Pseudomonadota bacterium]